MMVSYTFLMGSFFDDGFFAAAIGAVFFVTLFIGVFFVATGLIAAFGAGAFFKLGFAEAGLGFGTDVFGFGFATGLTTGLVVGLFYTPASILYLYPVMCHRPL